MKKYCFIFVLLFFLLLPIKVFGEADYAQRHVYMVEDFTINNQKIIIEGYSFMSHMDNYGGKNLKTAVIAYKGAWNNSYLESKNCGADKSCRYVYADTELNGNNNSVRDFWFGRCTDVACTSTRRDERKSSVENNASNFILNSSCNIQNGSHCLYYNVGFKAEFSIGILENLLSGSSSISFKIVAYINGVPYCREGKYEGGVCYNYVSASDKRKVVDSNGNNLVEFSDLSVYSGFIKNEASMYDISYSWGNNNVYYDATLAKPRDVNLNYFSEYSDVFYQNSNYNVLNAVSKNVSKAIGNEYKGSFTDIFINLRAIKSGNSVVPSGNNSDNLHWAPANHVIFTEKLTISKIKPKFNKKTCNDNIVGFNENNNLTNSVTVNCGEEKELNQCSSLNGVSGWIYVKVINNANCPNVGGNDGDFSFVSIDGACYLPVRVKTDILVKQEGVFKFGKLNDGNTTIFAGKGFGLGQTTYVNYISWINANYLNNLPAYYTPEYYMYINTGSGYVLDSSYDITNKGPFYYYDLNGNFNHTSSLKDAYLDAIDTSFWREKTRTSSAKVNSEIKFKSCDSNANGGCNVNNPQDLVRGGWSNIENKKDSIEVYNTNFGYKMTNSYNYKLENSYVVLDEFTFDGDGINYKYGDVIYYAGDVNGLTYNWVNTGNKFYTGFKYFGTLPFNISDSNPSLVLIDEMNWTLNGVCSLEVNDGLYRCVENCDSNAKKKYDLTYRYRSIALKNPFPKGLIADNWKKWWLDDFGNVISNNKERLANTLDSSKEADYSIIFSKFDTGNGKPSISDIVSCNNNNKCSSSYSSWGNLHTDGRSKFVTEGGYNFNYPSGTSLKYCGLGFFSSTNCDAYN